MVRLIISFYIYRLVELKYLDISFIDVSRLFPGVQVHTYKDNFTNNFFLNPMFGRIVFHKISIYIMVFEIWRLTT